MKYIAILLLVYVFFNSKITLSKALEVKAPNVLLILVDDLGVMDLATYGASFHETPHIDALANSSVKFTQAYAASTVCSPTRAALITGKSPERLQITDWIPGRRPEGMKFIEPPILRQLPLEEVTLAEAFKQQGYNTFFAGKWHLGGEGFLPEDQGFDINLGGHDKGAPKSYYSPYKNSSLSDGPNGEYLPDRLTQETVNFMKANRNKPFFAMLSFYTVHTPIVAAKPYLDYYEKKALEPEFRKHHQALEQFGGKTRVVQNNPVYASMVHALDVNIGRIMKELKDSGLEKDTIVIFTSDNGSLSTLGRVAPASTYPLRAGKGWVYEGGVRIPLIIRLPNQTKSKLITKPVISMDLFPTLMDLANITISPTIDFDGVSLTPLLEGSGQDFRNAVKVYYPHYHGSLSRPSFMVREDDWKLVYFYENEQTELYDLSTDIMEQNNIASIYPNVTKRLKSIMFTWLEEVNAGQPVKR